MAVQETLPLGVVLERRRSAHPWQDHVWRPAEVVPGAPPCDPKGDWTVLREGEGWAHFHAGTLPLELFRKDTEAYKVNLSQSPPRVFVVLRGDDDDETAHEYLPFLVTASPYEAQDYLDSGEEIVEAVTMPADVIAFVQAFIDRHHVDEPFHKRKRKRYDTEQEVFSRRPPIEGRGRKPG